MTELISLRVDKPRNVHEYNGVVFNLIPPGLGVRSIPRMFKKLLPDISLLEKAGFIIKVVHLEVGQVVRYEVEKNG